MRGIYGSYSSDVTLQAVAGVVGRAEELACIFVMLSFLSYVQACKTKSR